MVKLMNTGGVQWMELQSCNEQEEYDVRNYTQKMMPSEYYGESGTLHQWENKRNRMTSLFHQRLWLHRVSCVLVVLCVLLMSSSFLCCAAADGTDGILTTITSCFPSILVLPNQLKYYCEVRNARRLDDLNLMAGYYHNGEHIPAWNAFPVLLSNLIAFEPSAEAPLGERPLAFSQHNAGEVPIDTVVTDTFTMTFMNLSETTASFTSNSSYYGLKAMVQTKFPHTIDGPQYLLATPQTDCGAIANCTATAGCHDLTSSPFLPMPGNYSLCASGEKWQGIFVPWGISLLEVKVLVLNWPYMSSLWKYSLLILDPATGVQVTDMNNVFLVKCKDHVCQRVTSESGEQAVSVDVCTGSARGDRVHLSNGGSSFSLTAGVYAVCVKFGAGLGISPVALPVKVLQDPFVFNVTVRTSTLMTIGVRGGDLSWRKEPYEVCAVPPDTPCDSLISSRDAVCVGSASPNSPSVDINISSLQSKYGLCICNVVLCFVASRMTLNGRRYVWSRNVRELSTRDDDSEVVTISNTLHEDVITAVSFILLALVLVPVIMFFRWWRQEERREKWQTRTAEYQRPSRAVSERRSNINMKADSIRTPNCLLTRTVIVPPTLETRSGPAHATSSLNSTRTDSMRWYGNPMTRNAAQTQSRVGSVNRESWNAVYVVDNQMRGSDVMPRENEMRTRPSVCRYPNAPHNAPVRTDVVNSVSSRSEGEFFQGDVGYGVDGNPMRGNIPQYSSRALRRTSSSNDAHRGRVIILLSRLPVRNHLEDTTNTAYRLRELRRGRR